MNVLSLFDGISCARVALDRVGVPVKTYFACEIDKHAIKVSQRNFPDIVPLGDVREVTSLPEPIDLLIGGSPCTDLSVAKKNRQGLAGEHSSLFWEYVRLWKLLTPRVFILENVASMSKVDRAIITETLGVEPILIDAALVSAQSRKRLFWTNLPTSQPLDRGILLRDILEPDAEVDESFTMDGKTTTSGVGFYYIGRVELRRLDANGVRHDGDASYPLVKKITARENGGKSNTLTTLTEHNLVVGATRIRKLTPVECERLQGLPDGYTEGIAKTNRYKALGNAFNVDVIAHLLSTLS